ncbi:MAG TPA: LuxR C-terminal-related transcriptional regulator, partial [Kouleothrix sp.]|nr:LuxR C-terminal-related transcriptional regulator [Kouleothrix sp.]
PVGELLRQLLAEGAGPAGLAEQILAALPALPDSGGEYSQPLAEPLSQRELEILRLIDAGRSNREIAGQLVIEVSTVKRHVNNLFAKLAVGSRTQALARARTLGLL